MYGHLTDKILALPCANTLNKYIANISIQYDLRQAIYNLLAKK